MSLLCIAHRGGPLLADHVSPENSLEAIRRSLALGVDAIEIDVWQIEGELIVTHDRRLGRQLKGKGLITGKRLHELRQLQLENGEPVPLLTEVLELVMDKVLLNIELKGPDCVPALIRTLNSFTRDHQLSLEHYVVSSFDHQQLFLLKEQAPMLKRGVLIEGVPLRYAQYCEALKPYSLNTGLNFITQALIEDARQRGLKNWVYTVNHPEDWQWLLELNVDGVFTDVPDQLLAFNALHAKPQRNTD
jgi:glycerophosphoryl diester phosphodiesterase